MADRLGISSQLLGQYESGKRIPKTTFFLKWKDVFKEDLMIPKIEAFASYEDEAVKISNRASLEKSIENLTENELRMTSVIEKIVDLLREQYQRDIKPLVKPGDGVIPLEKGKEKTSR